MKTFVKIIKASEVKRGEARLIYVSDIAIAIFNAGGAFYATQGYCTRDGGSLSEGILSGTEIRCAGDKASFYLPTGDCTDPLGFKPLQTYRVRVDGDDIAIELRKDIRDELRREQFIAGYTAFQSIGCSWEDINQPGAYVSRDTGRLFRIPKEALGSGPALLIQQENDDGEKFVKVSGDPYVPSLKARMIAAENNIQPNF